MLQCSNSQTSCLQSKCSDGSDLSILSKLCDTVPGIQTFLTSFRAASIGEILLVHARKVDQQQVHLGKIGKAVGDSHVPWGPKTKKVQALQFWSFNSGGEDYKIQKCQPEPNAQQLPTSAACGQYRKRSQKWVPPKVVFTHFQTQMHAEHIIHSKLWKGFLKHHLLHCISTNWSRDLSCDEDLLTFYLIWWLWPAETTWQNTHIRHKESCMLSKKQVTVYWKAMSFTNQW